MDRSHEQTVQRDCFLILQSDLLAPHGSTDTDSFQIIAGLSHIDRYIKGIAAFHFHFLHACQCLHFKLIRLYDLLILTISSETANAVAAHRRPASILIIKNHFQRLFFDCNKTVCTDPRMTITYRSRQMTEINTLQIVHGGDHKIISASVIF